MFEELQQKPPLSENLKITKLQLSSHWVDKVERVELNLENALDMLRNSFYQLKISLWGGLDECPSLHHIILNEKLYYWRIPLKRNATAPPNQIEACPRCPSLRIFWRIVRSICEIKASECLKWKEHCHAHCKDNKWKKLRDTSDMLILCLMTYNDKAAFLFKYRSQFLRLKIGIMMIMMNAILMMTKTALMIMGMGLAIILSFL